LVRMVYDPEKANSRLLCRFLGRLRDGVIHAHDVGVGEAPRHEIAEYGVGRLSAAYGDLATAWRLRLAESRFSPLFLKGMLTICCL